MILVLVYTSEDVHMHCWYTICENVNLAELLPTYQEVMAGLKKPTP